MNILKPTELHTLNRWIESELRLNKSSYLKKKEKKLYALFQASLICCKSYNNNLLHLLIPLASKESKHLYLILYYSLVTSKDNFINLSMGDPK